MAPPELRQRIKDEMRRASVERDGLRPLRAAWGSAPRSVRKRFLDELFAAAYSSSANGDIT